MALPPSLHMPQGQGNNSAEFWICDGSAPLAAPQRLPSVPGHSCNIVAFREGTISADVITPAKYQPRMPRSGSNGLQGPKMPNRTKILGFLTLATSAWPPVSDVISHPPLLLLLLVVFLLLLGAYSCAVLFIRFFSEHFQPPSMCTVYTFYSIFFMVFHSKNFWMGIVFLGAILSFPFAFTVGGSKSLSPSRARRSPPSHSS